MNINGISNSITKGTKRLVTGLGKGDALLPVILLEAAVVAGRTYHAYDRGGFIEARERGTEEILGSIFWLGGVQAFNAMGDQVGKRVLKLDNVDFEVGKDAARNPIKNYIKKTGKYGEKTLGAFKFAKVATSVLLANAIIGFVVPKVNQAITKKYQKSLEQEEKKKAQLENSGDSFNNKTGGKDKTKPSFGMGAQTLLSLASSLENDARFKLVSTDVGVAGGRALNARNKYERREVLFRDISSMYFYILCTKHVSSLLNIMQNGKASRLDSLSADMLDQHLTENLKNKESYSAEEFERAVFGNRDAKIPENVQSKINNGIIKLEEFKKAVGANSAVAKRAELMSKLQPQLEGVSILTHEQVKDVYSNGLIDNPEFLNKVFSQYTGGKSENPMKFVADKDLRSFKDQMIDYVANIAKKAKSSGENITMETLKKANKSNFRKNAFNLGAGFAVSAYCLSTAIPKIQYWMTAMQTGKNKFPGVEKYDNKDCK